MRHDYTVPIYTIPLRTLQDKRDEVTLVTDLFTVPDGITGDIFMLRLSEIPVAGLVTPPSSTDSIVVREQGTTGADFTLITSGTPNFDQFLADSDAYVYGFITLNAYTNEGKILEIIYQGQGSLVVASDVNELADGTLVRDSAIKTRHLDIDAALDTGKHGITLTDGGGHKWQLGIDENGVSYWTQIT